MLARFFIDRPVFAWVIAIVIMLAGGVALVTLPVAQYPDIAPPSVMISASYPGASAESVENSVTQVLEEQLTGVDGLLYFSSSSDSSGNSSIQATFQQGTNPDTAQIQVQNKLQQALTRLPVAVQSQGITVAKSLNDFLMIVGIYDESDRSSASDVSDYLVTNLQDPIARVNGVGGVRIFGAQYAMRIWLDPSKLAAYNLMPADVVAAIQAQNVQMSAGKVGAVPAPVGQQITATVQAQAKLSTPQEFRDIILKYNSSGATVRIGDVARVEIGSENYDSITRAGGHPAAGLAVRLSPGANALSTAQRVRTTVEQLKRSMPTGYKVLYPKDSTPFIRISIEEVVKTLFEAVALVVLVMFVFLQSWRATLIPGIAVPVVLLGTFGVLKAFGYSINTLTMFALVLSIGLLVDDAIVVVENVERVMREQRLPPREATIQSMQQITGALIGVATSLSAVFLPMAFFSGSTGVIYRQFSITIITSMLLSVVVALTLAPALCASLLRPMHGDRRGFFAWFNRTFDNLIGRYQDGVGRVIAQSLRWLVIYAAIVGVLALLLVRLPTGFLPDEDQGEIMVQFTLPSGASLDRTVEVAKQLEKYFLEHERDNVDALLSAAGFSFAGAGSNAGTAFVMLKDWSQRHGRANRADAIARRATMSLASIRDARIFAINPPAIMGLGQSGGFEFQLLANAGTSRATLADSRDRLVARASEDPKLTAVRLGTLADTPKLHMSIDQAKASSFGLSMSDINSTLSDAWGGIYVNDFVDRARVKKVYLQGDAQFRASPEDIGQWYVRGSSGSMTSFSAFATSHWTSGPEALSRFNGLPAATIQGAAAAGVSSGTAMNEMIRLANELPMGTSYAFSGLSYQERLAGNQSAELYAVSILIVFLCLAALYESWSVPLSVLLVIPLGVIGSALAASLRGLDNNIYFQVALLTTIGLSSKNAILIVEFAEKSYRNGADLVESAMRAARLRLRPILMTSLAFVAGVLPLAVSTGAGANSRIAIGTGIVGGTATATALGIFLVPLFFVIVHRLFPRRSARTGHQDISTERSHA